MSSRYFDSVDRPREAEIRSYIREECDGKVVIVDWSSRSCAKSLHIPTEDGEMGLCRYKQQPDWRTKSLDVYPYGHKRFCTICLARAFPGRTKSGGEI